MPVSHAFRSNRFPAASRPSRVGSPHQGPARSAEPAAFGGWLRGGLLRFVPLVFALSLAMTLPAAAGMPSAAWGDELSDDEPDWTPPVSVSVERDGLPDDQARVVAEGVNDTAYPVGESVLELALPQGLALVDGVLSASADSLDAGDGLRVEAIVAPEGHAGAGGGAAGSANGSSGDPSGLAGTGDSAAVLVVCAVMLVAGGVAVLAWRRRRAAKAALSVVVVLCLTMGMVPVVSTAAHADEAYGASPAVAEAAVSQGSASATLELAGASYALSAMMSVRPAVEDPEDVDEADLTAACDVAVGATSARVEFELTAPLADALDAGMVLLDGSLAPWSVDSVERTGETSFALRMSGPALSDDSDGSVALSAAAFKDSPEGGWGVVAVTEPEALIAEADASAGQGYDADAGLFVLPVDLGAAEIADGASAADVSVPADPSIRVTALSAEPGAHEATVSLSVPGATPAAQLAVLDAALTSGGIAFGSGALTCGELTAVSQAADDAAAYGASVSALEYVQPTVVGIARAVAEGAGEGADGHAPLSEVTFEVDLACVDGGSVNLVEGGSTRLECFLDDESFAIGTIEVIDEDTVSVTVGLGVDHRDVLEALIDDIDGDGLCGHDAEGALDELGLLLASCAVRIDSGGVADKWGIPQESVVAPILYDPDGAFGSMAAADPAAAANAFSSDASSAVALASEGGAAAYSTATESLEAVNEALRAIGEFANAFAEGQVGDWFTGAGSVFGFIAHVIEGAEGEFYTMEDVVERLDTMQESLNSIERQVSGLSIQLDAIETRAAYRESINPLLSSTSSLTRGIASLVQKNLRALNLKTVAASFDELSATDQQTLRSLAAATAAYSRTKNTTTTALVDQLGSMLLGNTAIGATGVAQLYFDYVDTYYNWEPETLPARSSFLTYVGTAYVYGYMAAMCELNVQYANASEGDKAGIQQSIDDLVEQAGQVAALLAGTEDGQGKWTESDLATRTRERADGKVLNLVTGDAYTRTDASTASLTAGFSATALLVCPGAQDNFDAVYKNRRFNDLKAYTLATDVSGEQFQEMAKRLTALSKQSGYSGPTTLAEEIEKMGLYYQKTYVNSRSDGSLRSSWIESGQKYTGRYVISVNPNKVVKASKPSVKHAYVYTGDVFNIYTGKVETGVELSWIQEKYKPWKFKWAISMSASDYKVAVAG